MMAATTGQRTTENSQPEKAKEEPKATPKPQAKKAAPKKAAPKKHTSFEIGLAHNPFDPDEKVGVYNDVDVEVQRNENRAPIGEQLATLNVKDDGTATVSKKLPKGAYSAYGEDTELYLGFVVE